MRFIVAGAFVAAVVVACSSSDSSDSPSVRDGVIISDRTQALLRDLSGVVARYDRDEAAGNPEVKRTEDDVRNRLTDGSAVGAPCSGANSCGPGLGCYECGGTGVCYDVNDPRMFGGNTCCVPGPVFDRHGDDLRYGALCKPGQSCSCCDCDSADTAKACCQ